MKHTTPDSKPATTACHTQHAVCSTASRLRFHQPSQPLKYAQGFLLPAAIFLLVILAALGAYAVNISTLQQAAATQDVQGARAYQMARAGVEWAAFQVLAPGTADLGNCPASPSTLNMEGFVVTVTCTRSADYFEQGTDHTIAMYAIVATADFGTAGTAGHIQRQIQVTLSKCRGTDELTPYQCG